MFVSGQGAIDPATGQLAGPRHRDADRAGVPKPRRRSSKAAGTDLSHVLRCGVFLVDMRDFAAMNAVYARVFGDHRPARTTVAVSSLPHAGLRVEIDAVAWLPED